MKEEGEGGRERGREGGRERGREGEREGGRGEGERECIICITCDMHDCTLQNLEGLHHQVPPHDSATSIHAKQVSETLVGLQGEQKEPLTFKQSNRHS